MRTTRSLVSLIAAAVSLTTLLPTRANAQHVSVDLSAAMHVPYGFPENPDPAPAFHGTLGFGGRPGRSRLALYFVMSAARSAYATLRTLFESRGPFRIDRAITDLTAGLRVLFPIVSFVPRLRLELEARGGISFLESALRQLDVATIREDERTIAIAVSLGIQFRATRFLSFALKHEFAAYLNRNNIDYTAEAAGFTTAPSRGRNATMASLVFHF